MATKLSLRDNLWETYKSGYLGAVLRQQKRHGNSPDYGSNATQALTDEIVTLVEKEIINTTEAKRLARTLGKMEYGELGLSATRVEIPLRKILGDRFNLMLIQGFKANCPRS